MKFSASRRTVLKGVAAGSIALLAGARPVSARQAGLRIRRSALQLPANDPVFANYARAVELMHQLPMGDRRNWWRQAQIHADHCVHNGIDFLPWHRHYLNEFEKICGQLIGDSSFALPYWDWTFGTGQIPN